MQFHLTYNGPLRSSRDSNNPGKTAHKHDIRRKFHKQLKKLWETHPVLTRGHSSAPVIGSTSMKETTSEFGYTWKALVTESNGLTCELDILMLRDGLPGEVLHDIDNRLKTLFDALRKPGNEQELGSNAPQGIPHPQSDEEPFYVLLEDDRLITRVNVSTDLLLQPVEKTRANEAVRLFITVNIRPYATSLDNLDFA